MIEQYEGRPSESLRIMGALKSAERRAGFHRVQILRILLDANRVTAATQIDLMAGGSQRDADRLIRSLRRRFTKESAPLADGFRYSIDAFLALKRGDTDTFVSRVNLAVQRQYSCGADLYAACLLYNASRTGTDTVRGTWASEAELWARREGIADMPRFARMFALVFDPSQAKLGVHGKN